VIVVSLFWIIMDLARFYENCRLCPRQCKINRLGNSESAKTGFCGETDQLRASYIGPHFGEEPPISGKYGSGTVFLSGCSLQCSFCQNYQISHQGLGSRIRQEELLEKLENMIRHHHVHNINFITPDHFFPHIFLLVSLLRKKDLNLPIVFNSSGYQSVKMLKHAEEYVDIYLPDFKYSDSTLSNNLSKCSNYSGVALNAIAEMVRQKGFLDAVGTGNGIAGKGVLVRHLILPGYVENSINALTGLFAEFGNGLPLSLMSQYSPVRHHDDNVLNGSLSQKEFNEVCAHAQDLGFKHLFVQFPEKDPATSPYLPDFRKSQPFQ
jgi:putative pyruvate formate lyase activating enzyme